MQNDLKKMWHASANREAYGAHTNPPCQEAGPTEEINPRVLITSGSELGVLSNWRLIRDVTIIEPKEKYTVITKRKKKKTKNK